MGIRKIRHQWPNKDGNVERHALPIDYINELDDSEPCDTGCEYAMIDEQLCNFPYELYDLPDFKEILSLETWNLHLTEEERFHLAAYLPDMDQETFPLTMSELLGGANIYFGSPIKILFDRLRGGFYSLQVSQFRQGLMVLHKQVYYHSLRSYHEKQVEKVMEMRKVWSNCHPYTSAEERVKFLNNNKGQKPPLLVDLNTLPSDDEFSTSRLTNNEVRAHVPTKKAKGFLKIKPKVNSKSNLIMLPSKRAPKGVLKIMPKGHPTSLLDRPMMISVDSNQDQTFNRSSLTPKFTNGHRSNETRDICLKKVKRVGQHCRAPCTSSANLYQSEPVLRNSNLGIDDQLFLRYHNQSEDRYG